jgi:hypothetical protein
MPKRSGELNPSPPTKLAAVQTSANPGCQTVGRGYTHVLGTFCYPSRRKRLGDNLEFLLKAHCSRNAREKLSKTGLIR